MSDIVNWCVMCDQEMYDLASEVQQLNLCAKPNIESCVNCSKNETSGHQRGFTSFEASETIQLWKRFITHFRKVFLHLNAEFDAF